MGSSVQRRPLLAILLASLFTGCGYVGDPLPPALYIPLPVADLSAMQEGGTLAVRFTLPARTTEDLPMEGSPEVDLRAAAWEKNRQWDEAAWEREAVSLRTLPPEGSAVRALVDATPFAAKRILVRVRVAGKLGRFSAWSEPVALEVLRRPEEIRGLTVASAPDGVQVSWTLPAQRTPGMLTEVFRKPAGEKANAPFARLAGVPEDHWIDRGARFGESYLYQVRERLQREDCNYTGAFLGPLSITPVDTFPPAVPADVAVVAGATGAELSWTRNLESDFREYRVYRSAAGGEFQPVGEPTPTPTFSDTSAPREVALRYRVTSVDEAGNESAPSSVVEVTLP